MSKSRCGWIAWSVFIVCAAAAMSACAKKVAPPAAMNLVSSPPAPKPAPPPAPTISLTASPDPVTRGASTTLSWTSSNSSGIFIDSGIGAVPATGSRTISPSASTTYTATAAGPGGTATASARVTVVEPPAPPPAPKPLSDSEFFAANVNDVFFDFDKYNLRPDAETTIDSDAKELALRPAIHFEIDGHCDERGSEKYNLALGDRRAQTAKKALVAQGISPDRIDTVSYGKERPFDPAHDEDAWAKNRRDHFILK